MTIATESFSKESVKGGALLITGCCVGAGMIGLPLVTALSGFIPSILIFFLAWGFMISTGFLLLEANLWFQEKVNLLSIAEHLLGKFRKSLCGVVFLFLFFSLIIAYLSGTGTLLANFLSYISGKIVSPRDGIVICSFITGWFLFKGTSRVDLCNRLCIFGMFIFYILIVTLGMPNIQIEYLSYTKFGKSTLLSFPIILVAFGYQNLIPTLTTYLKRDVKKIKQAIFLVCSLPFFIYLLWEMVIFGLIPPEQFKTSEMESSGFMIDLLNQSLHFPHLNLSIAFFSFFALVTSLITVALSCVDFLSDIIRLKNVKFNRLLLCLTALALPTIFSLYYPNLFLKGLSIARGLGAVLLFGIIPVVIVWKGRYRKKLQGEPLLPGGRMLLAFLFLVSSGVFCMELSKQFHLL